eukprot:4669016-Amphidinium_carterae.1
MDAPRTMAKNLVSALLKVCMACVESRTVEDDALIKYPPMHTKQLELDFKSYLRVSEQPVRLITIRVNDS